MTITVRLFAVLRERAGVAERRFELPDGASVSQAIDRIARELPAIRDLLPSSAFAVNQLYVAKDFVLSDGDELALIPPVSGG